MGKEAIEKVSGGCVFLAGAGTGKTYTIVEKIKYLISNKIYSPEKIVCITFSNEAADNLLSRVRREIKEGNEPIIKTFHAFSSDLLRKHGSKIGIKEDFRIITPDEMKVIFHGNFKIVPYYCHKYAQSIGTAKDLNISIGEVREYLNKLKSKYGETDLQNLAENLQFELQTMYLKKEKEAKGLVLDRIKEISNIINLNKFVKAWEAYEKIKTKQNYQDYSDLNQNALLLLKNFPEVAKEYDYIIVDEFQDTNKLQLDILEHLAHHGNITVVGDLNQSIYGFRGAYKDNFNHFISLFEISKEEIFNLDKSYRSSNKILRLAYELILNNYSDKSQCFPVKNAFNLEGDEIEVFELKNAREEARKVVELIERENKKGIGLDEICVMFRTHQQGVLIRKMLESKSIKYTSVSKSSLLKNKGVKITIDYLTILEKISGNKSGGEQAWWDLFYIMGFSNKDLVVLGKKIKEKKESDCLSNELLEELPKLEISDRGKAISNFLIEKLKILMQCSSKPVSELVKDVFKIAGLINGEKTKEEKEVMLNLNKFYDVVKEQGAFVFDLSSFINYLDILNNLNIEIKASEIDEKGVRLMTLHSTKGLEYKTVIITNMAQGRFPITEIRSNTLIPTELFPEIKKLQNKEKDFIVEHVEDLEKTNQILEERRLCYVAFTRAKSKLILTYASEYANKKSIPSQFLNEVSYKENKDIVFEKDDEEKFLQEQGEIKPASFISIISSNNFDQALMNLLSSSGADEKYKSNLERRYFSPSALLSFSECQKRYEYKYVYGMPDEKIVSWDAIRLGSFVHQVLDHGVRLNFRTFKEFMDYAKELNGKEDWESVDMNEALLLIKVFYERNKDKYNERSVTEQELKAQIGGFNFIGFADRIDFSDQGLEIIDYKTGKTAISPKHRNWQLGYYAIAARPLGKVRKITLDMLKHEKPLEFEVDDSGVAKGIGGRMEFDINEIEKELVETVREVIKCSQEGFKPCPLEKNCEFCNEYVYGL